MSSKEAEKIKKSLAIIIEALVQHIIKLEGEKVEEEQHNRNNTATCMSVLHLFCLADYALLLPHFKNIRGLYCFISLTNTKTVYIHNPQKPSLVYHAVSILERLSPYINKPEQKICDQIETQLIQLIFSAPGMRPEIIEACISCLCNFSRRIKNEEKLMYFLSRAFTFIQVTEDNLKNEQRTCRLLYVAALFCRYHDFDKMTMSSEFISTTQLRPGQIVNAIYKNIITWFGTSSDIIKQKACRSLGFLAMRQPKLFLGKDSERIISQSLISENKDFVYQVVLMFKDFLVAEESKLSSASNKEENLDAG